MNSDFRNLKVTIMGLGLHGGGSASAEFFARSGAQVTVTDLRDEETLRPSMDALSEYKIRYVLGRHDIADFSSADIVIKNPAVKPDSPYLAASKLVETDISIFLSLNKRPVIAVTGSKGKSTTVSAIYHVLKSIYPETNLGGNITVSPLTFLDEKKNSNGSPVILELSSWQLADIQGRNLLKPCAAAITNIMHDHQDRYNSMADYADDKAVIFESQSKQDILILNADSDFTPDFAAAAPSRIFYITNDSINTNGASIALDGSGVWTEDGIITRILGESNSLKGAHNRQNLLTAAALLYKYGIEPDLIINGLSDFPGIAHRLEFIREVRNLQWYNDSAATIPEAAAAAVESFDGPVHLITGGTDKNLDFGVLAEASRGAVSISLLSGTGSDKIIQLFDAGEIAYDGPFDSLEDAVNNVLLRAGSMGGKSDSAAQTAVLSPGCASFGMFKNEFDRGDKFKDLINSL